jgi:hypothetical protein
MSFDCVELEEITDEDEYHEKRSSINSKSISTMIESKHDVDDIDNDQARRVLLEQYARDLVNAILVDAVNLSTLSVEMNMGVRELSDDENGLRELDENEMNETDEFIVFADASNRIESDMTDHVQQPSNVPRGSLNRLYTFSRIADDSTTQHLRSASSSSNQVDVFNESTSNLTYLRSCSAKIYYYYYYYSPTHIPLVLLSSSFFSSFFFFFTKRKKKSATRKQPNIKSNE